MNLYSFSPRIGRMSAAERAAGRYMRAPDGHGDIDITADLTGGADDAALGDLPHGAQDNNAHMDVPPGTVPAHGADAKRVNQQDTGKDKAEPSLRDQLSSAFKAPNGQPTDQQQAQTAKPPATTDKPALTKDGEGKYRQADGTFASAEQIAAFEAAQAASPQNQQQQQQSPVLQGLTPVEQQQFQSLPAELRQYVERTMEGLNTRGARYAEYDAIEQQILGPRRQAFAAEGSNPVVALNQLFQLSDFAGRDPGNFVLWFAQSRNLDLDALLDARDAQQTADPTVRQLQGQVQQLTGTLNTFQQGQAQAEQQARLNEVQTFASETDEAGGLKRPYLTDVMDAWATQITAFRTANPSMPNTEVLQKAYDAACWGDPGVRTKMQQAANTQQRQQDAARVAAAKQAGSSVTGAPSGDVSTIPNNANRTLREELQDQFNAARAV